MIGHGGDVLREPVAADVFLADDEQVLELTLNDDRARKLPMLRRERYWAIEVESAGQINTIRVGKNIRELA